jgi:hypothetical protein
MHHVTRTSAVMAAALLAVAVSAGMAAGAAPAAAAPSSTTLTGQLVFRQAGSAASLSLALVAPSQLGGYPTYTPGTGTTWDYPGAGATGVVRVHGTNVCLQAVVLGIDTTPTVTATCDPANSLQLWSLRRLPVGIPAYDVFPYRLVLAQTPAWGLATNGTANLHNMSGLDRNGVARNYFPDGVMYAEPVKITAPVTDSTASSSTPTMTGTGEPGASVTIRDDAGALYCSTTITSAGTWSCTLDKPLPEGTTTLTATQSTSGGITSTDRITIRTIPLIDETVLGVTAAATVLAAGVFGVKMLRRRAARAPR